MQCTVAGFLIQYVGPMWDDHQIHVDVCRTCYYTARVLPGSHRTNSSYICKRSLTAGCIDQVACSSCGVRHSCAPHPVADLTSRSNLKVQSFFVLGDRLHGDLTRNQTSLSIVPAPHPSQSCCPPFCPPRSLRWHRSRWRTAPVQPRLFGRNGMYNRSSVLSSHKTRNTESLSASILLPLRLCRSAVTTDTGGHFRRKLSNDERLEYIDAVQCLLSSPAKLSEVLPGAVARYDDFQGVHIANTEKYHFTVSQLSPEFASPHLPA
jgi:hypothetical protein